MTHMQIDPHALLIKKALIVATNPYILGGGLIYIVATVLYMYVISYYEYATSYAVIVGLSLIIAVIVASLVFNEKISLINLIGFVVIIAGIFLVLKK